jgi:tetratricopeptide (TPR) repeat protein
MVCVVSGLGATACGGKSKPPPTKVTLAAALKLQQAGKTDQAAQLYNQVLAADPKNTVAHFDLGVIAQTAKNNSEALQQYGQALQTDPTFEPALYNSAVIYSTTDPALAISYYRKIVSQIPTQTASQLNLGLLELSNNEVPQGIHNLAIAINQVPSYASHVPASVSKRVTRAAARLKTAASASASASP